MIALPADVTTALDRLTEGVSRQALAQRAAAISQGYRSGSTSAPIATAADALAYALTRMPATYAAATACLDALRAACDDFAPRTLLDLGAGPGTASFAAADAFPSLEAFLLADSNESLRALATELMRRHPRLSCADYRGGSARAALNGTDGADLVIASYMIGELTAAERGPLAELMWQRTREVLLIIEPGTPEGYARILDVRARLIAQGAFVIAPCPHETACPLIPPDWCHFAQRLPRTRDHKLLKGADAPFEDEKFSYVALSRAPPPRRAARVLAQPDQTKAAITAKLCTADGVVRAVVQRRDKAPYAQARRWHWGDGV
jgi:ribosomal protein RSM22 (predicted rRNA methylase)